MKKVILTLVALSICILTGLADEYSPKDIVPLILLQCHGPEDPTPDEELADYARIAGLSNADVSKILVSFIEDGLQAEGDNLQRQLTAGSLAALPRFGGEQEVDYVWSIVQTTEDAGLRRRAILVGMRMNPEKWEEWLRYVATDNRFDSLTRFVHLPRSLPPWKEQGRRDSATCGSGAVRICRQGFQSGQLCRFEKMV